MSNNNRDEPVNDDQLTSLEEQAINSYYQIATNKFDNQEVNDKDSGHIEESVDLVNEIVIGDFGDNTSIITANQVNNRIKSGQSDLVIGETIGKEVIVDEENEIGQATINTNDHEQFVIQTNQVSQMNRINSPRIFESLQVTPITTTSMKSSVGESVTPNNQQSGTTEVSNEDGKKFIISWNQLTYRVKLMICYLLTFN